MTPVSLEPAAPWSRVKHSTTRSGESRKQAIKIIAKMRDHA